MNGISCLNPYPSLAIALGELARGGGGVGSSGSGTSTTELPTVYRLGKSKFYHRSREDLLDTEYDISDLSLILEKHEIEC